MKEIELSQGYIALVDDADFETVSSHFWYAHIDKRKDGSIRNVYAKSNVILEGGKRAVLALHRFLLDITDPKVQVDHKDHNGLNCQRNNLRVAKNEQNSKNKRKTTLPMSSQFKGVYWYKPRSNWRAMIYVENKHKHLGNFKIEEQAAFAYDAAARKYFGEFAHTNFLPL